MKVCVQCTIVKIAISIRPSIIRHKQRRKSSMYSERRRVYYILFLRAELPLPQTPKELLLAQTYIKCSKSYFDFLIIQLGKGLTINCLTDNKLHMFIPLCCMSLLIIYVTKSRKYTCYFFINFSIQPTSSPLLFIFPYSAPKRQTYNYR